MQEIREQLKNIIKDLYGLDFEPDFSPSPENLDTDYSTNAPLKLAKLLHKPPLVIAEELKNKIDANISAPGFLNFKLSNDYLTKAIDNLATNFDASIHSDSYKGQTIICEFSDPNPFKVLHVGHLYTSIVGDSISRLFEYADAKVIRANFGGDVGLHVAKTMYILQQKDTSNLKIEDIANCYIEGSAAYEDNEAAKQEITKLNKKIYQINAAGKNVTDDSTWTGDAAGGTPAERNREVEETAAAGPVQKLANLYWRARELSYEYFKEFYAKIGVKFDKYYPESTVAPLGLKTVKEQLEKGIYEYSDGAVIFNGEKFGLHTRVFINKEGVPTYETKDVGLIFTKWQDYHFDKSVVITGNEQLDYMKVVLKSVEQYAPDLVKKTTHLTHGLVKLPGGVKMSSRKGNFLKAVDVLDLVNSALKEEFDSTDPVISLAATKYAFLKYKMGGNIIFDPHDSVKMTGNSGPYLLYSAVRAKKILSSPRNETLIKDYIYNIHEKSLAKKLLEYHSILDEAVSDLAPHKLASYLYELSQSFSRFYEHCPVVGSPEESERLKLVDIYLNVMTHGLNLLGITIPEEM